LKIENPNSRRPNSNLKGRLPIFSGNQSSFDIHAANAKRGNSVAHLADSDVDCQCARQRLWLCPDYNKPPPAHDVSRRNKTTGRTTYAGANAWDY